jgi:uncharacterized protein (TIGR03382 family)
MLLTVANAVVASMNVLAWTASGDERDVAGALAWAMSAAYWLMRGGVPL